MELPSKNFEASTAIQDDILKYPRYLHSSEPVQISEGSSPRVLEARAKFISTLFYSLALLALGGIVTGITYSLADSGGTYMVTTGLFVIGGIYFCVSIWHLIKWLALMAAGK